MRVSQRENLQALGQFLGGTGVSVLRFEPCALPNSLREA